MLPTMVISGVTGALVLAVGILHRSVLRQQGQINQLQADITAQKIAALANLQMPGLMAAPAADPEPVRKKKHLALYIGGAVAAALALIGSWFTHAWKTHRIATVATITTVTVGAAVAATNLRDAAEAGNTTPPPAYTQPLLSDEEPGADDATSDRLETPPTNSAEQPQQAGASPLPDGSESPRTTPAPAASTAPPKSPQATEGGGEAPDAEDDDQQGTPNPTKGATDGDHPADPTTPPPGAPATPQPPTATPGPAAPSCLDVLVISLCTS